MNAVAMKAAPLFCARIVVLSCLVASEILSDISISRNDENQALELKKDQFWKPLLEAAEAMQVPEHLQLCAEAQKQIAELPSENEYVRTALSDSTQRMCRANEALLRQAVESTGIAEERLSQQPGTGSASNIWSAGALFQRAIRHFVGEGTYADQLAQDVGDRQGDVLPVLRGTAKMTGSVLEDCRLSSKRAFDALKYDIYNRGVPKTPQNAKDLAYRLVDASSMTRKQFTSFVMTMVSGIVKDTQGKSDQATKTVVQASLESGQIFPAHHSEEQLINL